MLSVASMILMILSTIIVLSFVVMMFVGQKFDYMVETLEDDSFQLKELYSVGFAWSNLIPALDCKSSLGDKVRREVVLIYGDRFAEYYTRLYIAKALTFAHFIMAAMALIAGLVQDTSGLMLIAFGVVAGLLIAKNFLNEPHEKVVTRAEECVMEFPNFVTELALLLNSGTTLRDAWFIVSGTTDGELNKLVLHSCELMNNGRSEKDAIHAFGVKSGSQEIKKFSVSVIQSIEKGNAELSDTMMQQSSELWDIKRQKLLQKGEEAATKLIVPTSLMFVGVILVVLSSALSSMSF